MRKYQEEIINYTPFNEQEEQDKMVFLKYLRLCPDLLTRDNVFAHLTSSAFVVNRQKSKMLVVYHNIYDGWIYPGGHVDGESDFLQVALREVEEETSVKGKVRQPSIFAIQALPVKGHIKRGYYVSAHTHLDVVYWLEAEESSPLSFREEESKGVKWISFAEADSKEMVDFIRPIHKKLIKKLEK